MTVARSKFVDTSVTRYYHCISRCVRRAFLRGEGFENRKQWIEDRLIRRRRPGESPPCGSDCPISAGS
jgi:hypothetical protein